jgi:hypothetical protein
MEGKSVLVDRRSVGSGLRGIGRVCAVSVSVSRLLALSRVCLSVCLSICLEPSSPIDASHTLVARSTVHGANKQPHRQWIAIWGRGGSYV